jgi:hypothetical protein
MLTSVRYRDAAPVPSRVSILVECPDHAHSLNRHCSGLFVVLSTFGVLATRYIPVNVSQALVKFSDGIHEATWQSKNPTEKPLYIPANARCECKVPPEKSLDGLCLFKHQL